MKFKSSKEGHSVNSVFLSLERVGISYA